MDNLIVSLCFGIGIPAVFIVIIVICSFMGDKLKEFKYRNWENNT